MELNDIISSHEVLERISSSFGGISCDVDDEALWLWVPGRVAEGVGVDFPQRQPRAAIHHDDV